MSNPFAVVFFGALFPQFIDHSLPILPQLIILCSTYIVIDGIILILWGLLGIKTAKLLKARSFNLINKFCGCLMIIAAGLLATKDLQPQHQK